MTARGRSDETPVLVHFGVVAVIALLAGIVTLAALLVWWLG